ncbi:MAG: hypothetical protein JWN48_955 [Myxococcaceae bacterium]|nr:hypothetical protein [Myxococcaceae bacterium]
MSKGAQRAYWLSGDETCPHCLQRYSISVERRCVACDGAACPHCITLIRETSEVLCAACELENDVEASVEASAQAPEQGKD